MAGCWAMLLAVTRPGRSDSTSGRAVERQNEVRSLVSQLLVAEWDRLPGILSRLDLRGEPMRADLPGSGTTRGGPLATAPGRIALARYEEVEAVGLLADLSAMRPRELRVARERLAPWNGRLTPGLWSALDNPGPPPESRRRVACFLAHSARQPRWSTLAPGVAEACSTRATPCSCRPGSSNCTRSVASSSSP